MKARPIIIRARRRAALRIGLWAFAAAYHKYIAPAVAAAIEASKPLPRFATGGVHGLPQQGGEYVVSRAGRSITLPDFSGQQLRTEPIAELDTARLRASLEELTQRARTK